MFNVKECYELILGEGRHGADVAPVIGFFIHLKAGEVRRGNKGEGGLFPQFNVFIMPNH